MIKKTICIIVFSIVLVCSNSVYAELEFDLDTIVITASRSELEQYKLAGNVTVLNSEQIAATNAQTLPDVLKFSQGVNVYNFSTSKSSRVDIRGFGDSSSQNVLVLVNGRRVNSIDLSATDLMQIPLEAIERIEIIRGAGTVLYGDNAVGGVINIITKKGKGDLSIKTGGFYGSYDTQGAQTEVQGEYKGLSYFMYSKYFDKRGYRQNSDELSKDYNARLVYDFKDKVSVDFEAGRHQDTIDLPGGLDVDEIITLGRRGSADAADVITTDDLYYKMTFDLTPWIQDVYWGSLVVEYSYRDRDTFESFGASNFNTDRMIDRNGITGKYMFDHTILDREVHFVTGIDYYDTENDLIGSGTNSTDVTISKDEFAVFGFAEFEFLENLFANGGLRYQKADYEFDNRATASFDKSDVKKYVYLFGLKYEYAPGSNIHFNAQRTFRLLATDEFYSTFSGTLNTNLEHQRGIQFETGIKHNFDNSVIISVTPYYIRNTHEIFFDPVTFTNSNYPKTRRIGVEFGSEVDVLRFIDIPFFDKVEFFSTYTYQRPEFRDGLTDGKTIPLTAKHQATAGLRTRLFDYFNFSIVKRYVGQQFAINDTDNAGTPPVKPYTVTDAKISFDHKNIEVWATINNLFDKLYTPVVVQSAFTPSKRDHYPAPERNFLAGVNIKF